MRYSKAIKRGRASWKTSWKKLHVKLRSRVNQHGRDWKRSVWKCSRRMQNLRSRQNLMNLNYKNSYIYGAAEKQ